MKYDVMISMLRGLANSAGGSNVNMPMMLNDAADAIEDLQKKIPPVPHGRLIDADALPINVGWIEASESTHDYIAFVYYTDIHSAKTIIEAEET